MVDRSGDTVSNPGSRGGAHIASELYRATGALRVQSRGEVGAGGHRSPRAWRLSTAYFLQVDTCSLPQHQLPPRNSQE